MENTIELYDKLSRVQWLLHKQHIKTHASGGPMADTSRGQGRILAALKMKDGISTKDLSYLLGIRISSLNELLSKLEKSSYITREPSDTDKRVMLIHLTDKGREEKEKEQDFSGVFACLTAEEQISFGDYLDRIISALEAELGIDDERDGLSDWMEAARARMGAEQFDEWISMHGGMQGMQGMRSGFGGGPDRDDHMHSPHHMGGHGNGSHGKNLHSPFHKGYGRTDK